MPAANTHSSIFAKADPSHRPALAARLAIPFTHVPLSGQLSNLRHELSSLLDAL
jgi:hypothetical protein